MNFDVSLPVRTEDRIWDEQMQTPQRATHRSILIAVTRLEPSNEQLLEDRLRMEPPPEQVCRRFHFEDGIPDEYAWAFETEEQRHTRKWGIQQISVERWLAALKRERVTGHLSDTGEDLDAPKRRTWCVCEVCRRTAEIGRRRREEMEGR